MSDYDGFYENLTEYEELEGQDVENWLEKVKKGDSPEVTEKEKNKIREIHERRTATDLSQRSMETVEEESIDYDMDRSVVETSTGDIPVSDVKQVFKRTDGQTQVIYENEDGETVFGGVIDE